MHYNQFTIDYIAAIKRNFRIELNQLGEAGVVYEAISDDDIASLSRELKEIWSSSENAITILRTKNDSKNQVALFGLINDLDKAVKIGFLIGDRVVLTDYLFDRILQRKDPKNIDRVHLGVIASSLVALMPLAEVGRVVIIPHPFTWYPKSKQIIEEVASKTFMTVDLISLLAILSITKELRLRPYTIAESDELYNEIIDNQINETEIIGRDAAQYAYSGILGALLSEKLLTQPELNYNLGIPLTKFYDAISTQSNFHNEFVSAITKLGSLNADNNIESLKTEIITALKKSNSTIISKSAKAATVGGNITNKTFGLVGTIVALSAPLTIGSSLFALSATLTGLINTKKDDDNAIISVFKYLNTDAYQSSN